MSSYRKQFFEWVNKQPFYQNMPLQIKEISLNLVDCWLNNNQVYVCYTRLNGKGFAERCAVDFCWFIKNQTISDLQHRLEVAERTAKLACDELRSLNYRTFNNADIDFEQQFKEQAEKELKGEK